jgi:hypothetical protein
MSGYIGSQPVPQATQTRQTFTATSGQTSFATIGYVAGGQFIQVYLNGVLLKLTDDYTAANGSDIVLTSGAATGDILEFITFADFTVNNQNFTGGLTVDNDGSTVLTVDRATSDGAIIDVQKSGSSVGIIGVNGRLTIDGASDGVGLYFGGSALLPRESGSITDGTVGLGGSTQRFTDLYLSGGAYLGGTGSSNKLDDYEEGTWTPSYPSGWTGEAQYANYTKVGRFCYYNAKILVNNTSSGNFSVGGLPFTNGVYAKTHGAQMFEQVTLSTNRTQVVAFTSGNSNSHEFYQLHSAGGSWYGLSSSNINSNSEFYIQGVIVTA